MSRFGEQVIAQECRGADTCAHHGCLFEETAAANLLFV
jgi:hypothetical protein